MKWCLLLNNVPYLAQFLGDFSKEIIKQGDECIVLINSRIAFWKYSKYFHRNVKFFSKIEWLKDNYKEGLNDFDGLSWEKLFSTFDRHSKFKLLKFDFVNSFKLISQLYQFVSFIFNKESPDVVLHEPPANIFNEMVYYFSNKHNVSYIGLISSRFANRIDVYDFKYSCSFYNKSFKRLSNGRVKVPEEKKKFVKDYIKSFLKHKELPSYMKAESNNFLKRNLLSYYSKRLFSVFKIRLRYMIHRRHLKEFDYEDEVALHSIFRAPRNAIKRKCRIFCQRRYYYNIKNDLKKYFLFPLHLQPEASTSGQARPFSSQVVTIKNIAFSLPFPYRLYVKEHPAALGTRSTRFYKELDRIPNVVLVSASENIEKLINNSFGVITLTSTIGMEAALSGIPVYVLGDVFYVYHPLCRKINDFSELRNMLRRDLQDKPLCKDLEYININFGLSYFLNTIEGDLLKSQEENDNNNYRNIYMEIKKRFLQ